MSKYEAIGVVEARYYTSSIKIIDMMCKECEVKLLCAEKYLGGRLVTVIVGGSVSSVTQAVETVKYRFSGNDDILKNALVITRPHNEIMKYIIKKEIDEDKTPKKDTSKVEVVITEVLEQKEIVEKKENLEPKEIKKDNKNNNLNKSSKNQEKLPRKSKQRREKKKTDK